MLRAVVAEPGHRARLIVVVPVEGVPADLAQAELPLLEVALQHRQVQVGEVPFGAFGLPVQADVLEGEHHV